MADKQAEKNRYPQIPSTVWWGVRSILNRTPNATLDERFLAIQLEVQEAAARQYIAELIGVGILNEEKKATPLAHQWRLEESYSDAVEALLKNVYPQALLDLAPHAEGNRQKATSYFMREGLGQGAAGNKAATYFLIGAPEPNDSPTRGTTRVKPAEVANAVTDANRKSGAKSELKREKASSGRRDTPPFDNFPLNVNVQIHISADAGSEQIEAIFSAMKRYLNDTQTR